METIQETTALVPVKPEPPVRNEKGQFIAGHGGLRKGSPSKITKAMRLAALEIIEAGGDAGNPLLILYRIGTDPATPLKVKLDAADRLAKHLWGVKNAIEIEPPDPADEDRIARTRRVFAAMFVEEVSREQQP